MMKRTILAVMVVVGLTGGALTGSAGAGTLDTPATDAALFAAVANLWSTVAGCITNP